MVNVLAVVAHHDDPILWVGGTILRTMSEDWGWTWTIIGMCIPENDKLDYFTRCCNALGATQITIDFGDYQEGHQFRSNSQEEMRRRLIDEVTDKKFDIIFTHSRDQNGEYGYHANHDEVQTTVTSLAREGFPGRVKRIVYFSYSPIYCGLATTARQDAIYYHQLNYEELCFKVEWCLQTPDVGSSLRNIGFPCPNPEAFEGDDIQFTNPFIRRQGIKTRQWTNENCI